MRSYVVKHCFDDLGALQRLLDTIAESGGRVISVMWQPDRELEALHPGYKTLRAGFTIISEYEEDA